MALRRSAVAIEEPLRLRAFIADAVLLVAGGIGVTPVSSIFRELYIRRGGPAVTLLWVRAAPPVLPSFWDDLRAAVGDDAFRLALYVDGEKPRDRRSRSVLKESPSDGRPDVQSGRGRTSRRVRRRSLSVCGTPAPPRRAVRRSSQPDAFHSERARFFHQELLGFCVTLDQDTLQVWPSPTRATADSTLREDIRADTLLLRQRLGPVPGWRPR